MADVHKNKLYSFQIAGALTASFVLVSLLFFFFEPMWMTNDDVGMSMVAHGYGLAAIDSPNLIFSNILWGYLVRALPEINGIPGYSLTTMGVLVLVGAVILLGLSKQGLGRLIPICVMLLILLRSVLFPQFTINAGLLALAGVVCFAHFRISQHLLIFWAGCFLVFLGYLVRSQELFLVLFVACPLLPWKKMWVNRRAIRLPVVSLILLCVISSFLNHRAYQQDEWNIFNDLNMTRAMFTDFHAGESLKKHPEILEKYGYTANDISLISNWFFVDLEIADPGRLQAMLKDLGSISAQTGWSVAKGWVGVRALWHPVLLPLFLAAICMALFRPSWRSTACWGLCVAAVFILGFIGRPGILRVYIPLVSLLVIAPFLSGGHTLKLRYVGLFVLLCALLFNGYLVFPESIRQQYLSEKVRDGLKRFPRDSVIVWGNELPYAMVYPVFGTTQPFLRIYPLACFTWAPFSVAFVENQQGMVCWIFW